MPFETKFIQETNSADLTRSVNKAEAEGWEFVSVQVAMTASAALANPNYQAGPGHQNFYITQLATLRRPRQA